MIKLCLDNTGLKRPITILESLIQLGEKVNRSNTISFFDKEEESK
jgi:hypothetical protein